MEFLNQKILNISLKTWIFILISLIILFRISKSTSSENMEQNKKTIYNFNTSWCKYSKEFQPIWNEFEKQNTDNNLEIVDVKCDDESLELCNKYPIKGFPTVILDNNGKIVEFQGNRNVKDLINFVK